MCVCALPRVLVRVTVYMLSQKATFRSRLSSMWVLRVKLGSLGWVADVSTGAACSFCPAVSLFRWLACLMCLHTPNMKVGPLVIPTSQRENPKVIHVPEVPQCPSLPFQEALLAWQC